MNLKQFRHILKTEFEYQSRQNRYSAYLASKFSGWSTIVYYARLLTIILTDNVFIWLKKYDFERWAKSSLFIFKSVEAAGGSIDISGLKGVAQQQQPLVFVANHMSMLDAFILPCLTLIFGNTTFVVKEQLLKYPLFGNIMKAVHPIAIKRENPREDLKEVLDKGQKLISKGLSIIIFPQSTRSDVFDAGSFNSLGVKLAKKAGVPVVPVVLKTDFQKNGKIIKELGCIDTRKTVFIKFGTPMRVTDNGRSAHREIVSFMEKHLKMWGAQVRSE